MRRFAFVDVNIPQPELYRRLLQAFTEQHATLARDDGLDLLDKVCQVFDETQPQVWPLMRSRALGPAIAQDMIAYLAMRLPQLEGALQRAGSSQGGDAEPAVALAQLERALERALAEAFNLYATPQLDGLDQETITAIYGSLHRCFGRRGSDELIRPRIRDLFPHIQLADWLKAVNTAETDDQARVAGRAQGGTGNGRDGS
jgi:hypothetical protein